MIWPAEALLLASTKLRTRRIRLVITILITSLLFTVLVFVAVIVQGTVHSLTSFGKEGYGNRYLVQANPLSYQTGSDNQGVVDSLKPQYDSLVARKKAEAKRLGLEYDEKSDTSLPLIYTQNGPNSYGYFPNYDSDFGRKYLAAKNDSISGSSFSAFTKAARDAGAIHTYQGTQSTYGYRQDGGHASVIVGGKEDLAELNPKNGPTDTTGVRSIATLGWRSLDAGLLQSFLLPHQNLRTGDAGSVPVIAPFSAAEQILGLKPLPETATAEQRLARLTTVRRSVAGKTIQLCYRNSGSLSLINEASEQQKQLAANKNNKNYQKPSLTYALPTAPCAPVAVAQDSRSYDEKLQAKHQRQFDEEFGQYQAPTEGMLTLRVVGLNPDVQQNPGASLAAAIGSLLTSSTGSGWVSPSDAVTANQLATTIQDGNTQTVSRDRSVFYAEFGSLEQMQRFIKNQTCKGITSVRTPTGQDMSIDSGNYTKACIAEHHVFTLSTYGNSAGAIEQLRSGIWKVARYVLLVIVVIAALIMMGNIGKIIADSRRETAVFRALGAKRLDIIEVYLSYTILLSLLISAVAITLGLLLARLVSGHISPELSVAAVIAYNAQDVHKHFSLFGINLGYLGVIVLLVLFSGLLSAILPLLANTRRNPIRDMRDDT